MKFLRLSFCFLLACSPAWASGVDVGDKAPPLVVRDWVRGEPVDLAKDAKNKLHIVEFWATWCPPCKASVPLLTQYQKKYKDDLVIIGVTDPDPYRNAPTEIKQFVKSKGADMDYTVAIDDRGQTSEAYLNTDEPVGIPQAFLVGRDGRVIWEGSPLDPAMGTVLKDVIAGRFDIGAAVKGAEQQREVDKRLKALDLAFQMGQLDVVWDGLIDIFSIDPANDTAMQLLAGIYVTERKFTDKFKVWARQHIEKYGNNQRAMITLATTLLEIGDISARVPKLALDAARAAYTANKKDPVALGVYAQALYTVGALDKAIEIQGEAVAAAGNNVRDAAQDVLVYYETCKKLNASVQ